jgi:hypothetical protein
MISMKRLASGSALAVLALAAASAVHAQETTGAIRGVVKDESGASVSNATVTIVHVPTGATLNTVSSENGFFSARGLRVGGPYSIKVAAPNYDGQSVTLPALGVGDPADINLTLFAVGSVEAVTVTAASASGNTQGPGTNFTGADVQSLPSISRDLKDVARLDPFATIDPTNQDALSFAGTNTRFNQLTVDGNRQNDDFGLNNNGYPTQRSPISIDAVGAVQVSIAPFSVVNNGFLGGSINAVTKSGTNEFHGTLFGEKTNQDMRGDSYTYYDTRTNSPTRGDRVEQKVAGDFSEKTWGATLGGPIIKDKAFFFLSYEKYEGNFFIDEGPIDSGRGTTIPRITQGAIDTFQSATKTKYGYDPGNWVRSTPPITDKKLLAKFDWNITDNQRLQVTLQDTKSSSFNGSTSDLFASGDSTSTSTSAGNGAPRIGLTTSQYVKDEHLTNYTVQLNSRWTDAFTTELRVGRKETDTVRTTPGGNVGQVTVNVNDLAGVQAGAGNASIRFGTELNSQPNYLNVFVDTVEARARYTWDAHEFLVGFRNERNDITNIFGRNYLPTYAFSSYANFLAGRADTVALVGAVSPTGGTVPATAGTAAGNAAKSEFWINTLYAEDTIQATDDLSILVGARYDWFVQNDKPILNTTFVSRNSFSNQANLDGKGIVLPRVYARWTPTERFDLAVGFGRFSSQGLNVWTSNPFGNDGVRQVNAVCPAGPYTLTNLGAVPTGCTLTPGNGNTNALDPALKIASVWKTTVSAGYNFDLGRFGIGDDWRVQGDFVHAKNQDSLYWKDLRAQQVGVAPDGRPVYGRTTTGTIGANVFDMLLTNLDDGGKSDSAAISLGKDWRAGVLDGLSFKTSYTYTKATDANPMTSSIADSSYTRFASSDHQNPRPATSDYEVRNKFSLNASYERKFFGDNKTSLTMYAQRRSGLPFSYTFANSSTSRPDVEFGNYVSTYSGRQATSNQLLYVPKADSAGNVTATSDTRVNYAGTFNVAAFNEMLHNTGLIKYAGEIAPRNGFRGNNVTTVDLHFSQEFPAFVPKGAKLLGYIDIENFGNMLNNKWGVLEQYDFYRGVSLVDITCAGAGGSCAGQAAYTYSNLNTAVGQNPAAGTKNGAQAPRPFGIYQSSLWQIKVGVKYQF